MKVLFPIEKTLLAMEKAENPQVILWFTNYFGSAMTETLKWYKENLFSKVKNVTFWLTDLKAWSFLSVDKQQLKQTYKQLTSRIEDLQKAKETDKDIQSLQITITECPMTTKSSDIVNEATLSQTRSYKLLSSKAFFKWLLQNEDTTIISDDICNKLCKDYPREDSLRFSLSDIGYKETDEKGNIKPKLLNRSIAKLNNKTLLDVDFSMAYPILQYLEGIYYASTIIKQCAENNENKECSIIFMLPNKEFTYYILPDEPEFFNNFCQGIKSALSKTKIPVKTAIRFEPFAYGTDFYDAPYKFGGSRLTKGALLKGLIDQGK
jgi:hypothetical protein